MLNFLLFTHDDRYSIPTIQLVIAETERQAIELAQQHLEDSRHHMCVELCRGDEVVYRLPALAAHTPEEKRPRENCNES